MPSVDFSRFKPIVIAWIAFDILAFILFAAAAGGDLTVAKLLAFLALLGAGAVAAAALILLGSGLPRQGAPLVPVAAAGLAIVYVLLAAALSVIFMTGLLAGAVLVLLLQLILLALFVLAAVGLRYAFRRKAFSDAGTERRADLALGLLSRAQALLAKIPEGSPEAKSLEASIEEIRYFDKNSSVPSDRLIADKLVDLEAIFSPAPASGPLAPAPRPSPGPASPEAGLLESLEAAASEASPASGPPEDSAAAGAASGSPLPDPAAQRANAVMLLRELQSLTARRREESLNSKRGGF
ncbi:MAG: hypothetical protein LBW85_01715 [Deltaproteobacteria bacterium]|jgi:hypothetical protein|nr:hypothetical protein [Deltaproteobacteria bacterium]